MSAAGQPLLQVAARQLGVPQRQVPQEYVRQLQLHPEAATRYADFSFRKKEGHGYGLIYCHVCDGQIALGQDRTLGDGGRTSGIGNLDAYMEHCRKPGHQSSPAENASVQAPTTLGTSGRSGANFSSSSAFRLPVDYPKTWTGPGARKRLFDAIVETRSSHLPTKRVKIEQSDARNVPESLELGSPPPPHTPRADSLITALQTQPLQSVGRINVPSAQAPVPMMSGQLPSRLKHTKFPNDLYARSKSPFASGNIPKPLLSSTAAPRPRQPHQPVTLPPVNQEVLPSSPIGPLPVPRVESSPTREAPSCANRPTTTGDSDEDGIDVWIRNAANAEVFEENATVQSCMQKIGLKEQSQKLPGMQICLLPHQLIGVAWMHEQETSQKIRHFGGILADEMGLGKTVQMIATMTLNPPKDMKCKTTLIVCPISLVEQWKAEIETKTTDLYRPHIYHGSFRAKSSRELQKYDVVITTYHMLARELPKMSLLKINDLPDEPAEDEDRFGPLLKTRWYRIILDEAQIIRNRSTRASSAAARLKATYRWCLTGTPIVNSLSDAFSLIRVLRIRPWYEWQHFNWQIVKNEQQNPALCGKRLQNVFRTCLLRRNKNSMLDGKRLVELPPKTIKTVSLEFSREEREIYDMVEQRAQKVFNRFLRQGTVLKNYSHVLVLLMRLRQCACHPALIQEDYYDATWETLDEDERDEELRRARQLISQTFVNEVKQSLLKAARERIRLEQVSLDAQVEEECLLCSDNLDEAVIAPCQHAFCRGCALKLFEVAIDEQADISAAERPCPQCHVPFKKEYLFLRSAFEPMESDLASSHSEDECNIRVRGRNAIYDSDDEVPASTSARRRTMAVPAYAYECSETEDNSDDSLSDFIVQSDENEQKKDARKAFKKRNKGKARAKTYTRERESSLNTNNESTQKERKPRIQRYLPSTKMKCMIKFLKLWKKDHPKDKTIVISQFVSALDIVAGYLKEQGLNLSGTRVL